MIVRDDEKVKKTIAENIVRYRRECNLTQAELAEKIHYSDKSVSKWERADGVPDIFVLVMLAELFGVTVNDLLTEKHRKSHRAAPKLKRSIITHSKSPFPTFREFGLHSFMQSPRCSS